MARTYTAYNIRIILVLTLGSLTFGYAYSVISNTLGQPGFIAYFGLDGPDQSYANAITGAINGMFSAGGVFGALLAGWMCEARGRKETMNLAALITIVGAAIQTGSVNIAMFLAARFITGWGIGMMVVLIPLYQAEICKSGTKIDQKASEILIPSSSTAKRSWLSCRSTWKLDRHRVCNCRLGWCWNLFLQKSVLSMALSHCSLMSRSPGSVVMQSLGSRIT